jgi:hypothetical protein
MTTNIYQHTETRKRALELKKGVCNTLRSAGNEVDEELQVINDVRVSVRFGEVGAHYGSFGPVGGKNMVMVSFLTPVKAPYSADGRRRQNIRDTKKHQLTVQEIVNEVWDAYRRLAESQKKIQSEEEARRVAEETADRLTNSFDPVTLDSPELGVTVSAYVDSGYGIGRRYPRLMRGGEVTEEQAYTVSIDNLSEAEVSVLFERLPKALKGLGK